MIKSFFLAFLSLLPAFAQSRFEIDPVHSSAQFAVRHMMISNVRGEFEKVSGSVLFDANNLAASKVEATIDAASINTRNEKRDGHLKSAEFFDVANYPTLSFKSTKIEKKGDNYVMTGDLTIHGVTKQTAFTVEGPARPVKDPKGIQHTGASATTTINRKDFGLVWNKAMDSGGAVVGDEVRITLDVEMAQKPDQPVGLPATN